MEDVELYGSRIGLCDKFFQRIGLLLLLGDLQRFINVTEERIGGLICGFPYLRQLLESLEWN